MKAEINIKSALRGGGKTVKGLMSHFHRSRTTILAYLNATTGIKKEKKHNGKVGRPLFVYKIAR